MVNSGPQIHLGPLGTLLFYAFIGLVIVGFIGSITLGGLFVFVLGGLLVIVVVYLLVTRLWLRMEGRR